MLENMKFKSTNNSGSLAAAYLIFSVGLLGVTFSAALAFHRSPEIPMFVLCGGGALAVISIALRMRPDLPSECLTIFARGQRRSEFDYVPKLVKSRPMAFGTNRPPTVEEIRDLKETERNWVPSKSRSGRTSLKGR